MLFVFKARQGAHFVCPTPETHPIEFFSEAPQQKGRLPLFGEAALTV